MYGFGSFWLIVSLSRLFFYIFDYILEGTYSGDLYVIIVTSDVVLYIFLYFYLYFYIYIFINIIIIIVIFIWFSFKSKHEFQAISSIITIGFVTFLIGWTIEAVFIKNLNIFSPAIPSILVIIGAIIAIFPSIGYFEFFSKTIIKLFIIIMIILIALFLGFNLFFNLQLITLILFIIWSSVFTLILVIGYVIYRYAKRREYHIEKEEIHDTIQKFARQPKFSVEDVKYHRDKGLCLVCKNKISGLTYVCPNCNVWYCIKCAEALIGIENICWVCQTPLDRSKPVKNQKKLP
ncbi:MAG: hypothetical protein ACFFBV_09265 [Promethearchaeota archaeon]